MLACASRSYFEEILREARAHPLLLTNGLMAPEAYTLDAAVTGFYSGHSAEQIAEAASLAYARFQKCSPAAARRLFVVRR
ncbi:hypothetical protein GF420_06500 [candidate division GN15 bacterium]|nr:hypothetical protein [candidate division GN15 bacterium]